MKELNKGTLIVILIIEIIFFVSICFGLQGLIREKKYYQHETFTEVDAFNNQFEQYVKNNAKANDIRAICAQVFSSNNSQRNHETNHLVSFIVNGEEINTIPILDNYGTYSVKLEKDEKTGYINKIIVIKNK